MVLSYLCKNQFMQKNVFFHVGRSNCSHDQKTADHQSLTPCLKDQSVGIGRPHNSVRHGNLVHYQNEKVQERRQGAFETV